MLTLAAISGLLWWHFSAAPMDYTQSPDWYAGPV